MKLCFLSLAVNFQEVNRIQNLKFSSLLHFELLNCNHLLSQFSSNLPLNCYDVTTFFLSLIDFTLTYCDVIAYFDPVHWIFAS
jgi:hypothetical protein